MNEIKDSIHELVKKRRPILLVAFLVYLLATFHRNLPAVMGPRLIEDIGLTPAIFGTMGLAYMWGYALMQMPVGAITDKVGSRKSMTLFLGLAVIGAGFFAAAFNAAMLILSRILIGMATAGFFIGAAKVVASWYPKKDFGRINSLLLGIGAIGGVFATTPMEGLMAAFGWRMAIVIILIITLVLIFASHFIIRDQPSDVGLSPPDVLLQTDKAEPQTEKVSQATTDKEKTSGFLELVKNPGILLIGLYFIGVNSTGQVFAALWGGVLLEDVYGFAEATAADILFLLNLSLVIGCFTAFFVLDKIRAGGVMISGAALFTFTLFYAAVFLPDLTAAQISIIYAVIGFSLMYCVSGGFAMLRQIVSPKLIGGALGLANGFSWLIGAGLFQQLWGLILSSVSPERPYAVDGFTLALWVQFAMLCLSLLFAVYLTITFKKREQEY